MNVLVSSLKKLFFVPYCVLCRSSLEEGQSSFCNSCLEHFEALESRCHQCAEPFGGQGRLCHNCHKKRPHFDQIFCAFRYSQNAKKAIWLLKYRGKVGVAKALVDLYLPCELSHVDYIIPIPLSFKKRWVRKFNQSTVLADALGKKMKTTVLVGMLKRKSYQGSQTRKSVGDRFRAVKDAFILDSNIVFKGKTILLVDDVVTTGATSNECAKLLKKRGAKQVFVWAVARASRIEK